ncbi:hypothetical protein B0H16DRAFT_537292 [Mycena metata]|uniref:Uncharacterized protein n=1 Tax=Mycena metata TaxID=1033252 RepID=A0AAD7NGR9_9AGAR|nr:hypothetical protein B0H16DRAFT_537292 [Mycena metata]
MGIPQDLVWAILQEVDDHRSLKMSVAGIPFREPAQRMLLNSLNLGIAKEGGGRPYTDAMNLLQESPHIASYFTRLYCLLPEANATDAEVHALCTVLYNLSNVRHCSLRGATDLPTSWTEFSPSLCLAIAEFIGRQRLAELEIHSIGTLPDAVLALCFGAAPTLSLINTSADMTAPPMKSPASSPIVQNLLVLSSPGVVDVLTSPNFGPQMTNIRKLWWDPDVDTGGRLISMLAPNLEHIRVQYKHQSTTAKILSLPPMQLLESAEVTLEYEWMLPFHARLESILTAAPDSLREICITFTPKLRFLHQTALARMDDFLTDGGAPLIRWRLDVEDNIESSFIDFVVSALEQGMPRLHAQGKLLVERRSISDRVSVTGLLRGDCLE